MWRTRAAPTPLSLLSLALACSSPATSPARDRPGGAPAPGGQGETVAATGDACRPDRSNLRSTCAAGAFCAPFPGGYCTHPCGATGTPCEAGSTCVPTVRGGEMCARSCTSDADCRADQGYACDPGRKACGLPFMAPPRFPSCPSVAPPDGDFSAAAALSTAAMPGVYQLEPGAALTPSGDLVVVFTSGGRIFERSHLGVARVPAGGEPVIDRPLATSKRNHFNTWVAAGRDGAVHAVWLGHDGGGVNLDAEIGYARSSDGGATWTAPVAIHAPQDCPPGTRFCLDKPMIAVGPVPGAPAREAVRAFYSADAAGGLRMRSSLDGGATWTAPVTAVEGTYADVTIDGGGRVHVAVSLSDPSGAGAWGSTENQIAYAVSRDGESFARPVPVSAPGESIPFFFVNPTIAVNDTRGWIHIAYAAGTPDGRWDIRLASSRDRGRSWRRRAVNDDPTCANHSVPNLALDPASGALHVTWYENRGGAGHLAYTTCKPGGGCAPSVRGSSDMAAYELVRHSSKWLGGYQALLVDPKRRVLHSVWTHTVQEGEHAIARLRHATRRLSPR